MPEGNNRNHNVFPNSKLQCISPAIQYIHILQYALGRERGFEKTVLFVRSRKSWKLWTVTYFYDLSLILKGWQLLRTWCDPCMFSRWFEIFLLQSSIQDFLHIFVHICIWVVYICIWVVYICIWVVYMCVFVHVHAYMYVLCVCPRVSTYVCVHYSSLCK